MSRRLILRLLIFKRSNLKESSCHPSFTPEACSICAYKNLYDSVNILKYCLTSLLAVALTLLVTHPAPAQFNRLSTAEQAFTVEYNQHGAVLTPEANSIYLGRNCEAYAPHIGTGQWGQANGGLQIALSRDNTVTTSLFGDSFVLGFPRQNIRIPNAEVAACPLPLEASLDTAS